MSTVINAENIKEMFLYGASNLNSNKEIINELNVFPVPDGDTGTNMTLTILSAASEVNALETVDMKSLCKAISSGSLKGARGNSGVILSQLLRGLTKGIRELDEVTTKDMAHAFELAVESAYKAVMKPKEGTILTVAKAMSDKASEIADSVPEIEDFLKQVIDYGNETLDKTPDMLPVLKEAGVVDSGGKGLMTVISGAYTGLTDKSIELNLGTESIRAARGAGANAAFEPVQPSAKSVPWGKTARPGHGSSFDTEIKYGYCTEFIIILKEPMSQEKQDDFKEFLTGLGDSLVLVADDEYCKVHVHTNHPGKAFERAIQYGELTSCKIDNMREEHREQMQNAADQSKNLMDDMDKADEPRKNMGLVAVSIGDGMNEIFRGLSVDYLVEGGQTMNPSTEDMLSAINHVNADTVFVFPNNKNIIMAANQARDLTTDKEIIVIPTTTVPQGISAVIAYDPAASVEENRDAFNEARNNVKTGQVTYAVRDTSVNGMEVHKKDIMGMDDSGIKTVGQDINKTALDLMKDMTDEDSELLCIYYGQDINDKQANKLLKSVEEAYPACDVELNYGGQPVYYYIVSVE